MGTIKADSIQPIATGSDLVVQTGSGNVERIRIRTTGETQIISSVNAANGLIVSKSSQLNGNIGVTGDVLVSGQSFASIGTTASDTASTLTTKSFVDSQGIVIFDNAVNNFVDTTLSATQVSTRQTIELHPTIPETAKYVILISHLNATNGSNGGQVQYNFWMGKSTTLNTGHRIWQGDASDGDQTTNSTQSILPIHKISATSRRIYWNISAAPNPAGDQLRIDLSGYVI